MNEATRNYLLQWKERAEIDIRYPGDIMVSDERDALRYKEIAFNVMHLVQGKLQYE
jgi:hypothetical protein